MHPLDVGHLHLNHQRLTVFFEIGHSSDVATQVVNAINRKLYQLMVAGFAPNSTHMHSQHAPCSLCSSPMYHINDCPTTGNFYDASTE
jgi:hypothetical protein